VAQQPPADAGGHVKRAASSSQDAKKGYVARNDTVS